MLGGSASGLGEACYLRPPKRRKKKKKEKKKNSSGRLRDWACSVRRALPRAGSARRVFRAAAGAGPACGCEPVALRGRRCAEDGPGSAAWGRSVSAALRRRAGCTSPGSLSPASRRGDPWGGPLCGRKEACVPARTGGRLPGAELRR